MNPRFKPLVTPPAETGATPRPFQLKVVPAETTTLPFKPLSSMLPVAGPGAAAERSPYDPGGIVEPGLEIKRQGDRISRITVTCNCGRLHEIVCEY